jgi:hypothetical protein
VILVVQFPATALLDSRADGAPGDCPGVQTVRLPEHVEELESKYI